MQHVYIGASTEDMLCVLRFLSRFAVSRLKYKTFQSQFQSGTSVKNFQLGKKKKAKRKRKKDDKEKKIRVSKKPKVHFYFSCFSSVVWWKPLLQHSNPEVFIELSREAIRQWSFLGRVIKCSREFIWVFACSLVRCCTSILLRKKLMSSWCGWCLAELRSVKQPWEKKCLYSLL